MQINETIGVKFERFLTQEDKEALKSYNNKIEGLRAMTNMVALGSETGLMLFGSGGNGKSYSIREALRARKMKELTPNDINDVIASQDSPSPIVPGYDTFITLQGRITPKGLVIRMKQFPKSILLIEDAETMFDDKNCWGVLRMALHSQDTALHSKRHITWTTSVKEGTLNFDFHGGLIIVGNRKLPKDNPEVDAVKTRCNVVELNVTKEELTAKMKEICEDGYNAIRGAELDKQECYSVLQYMLEQMKILNVQNYNFRILIRSFRNLASTKIPDDPQDVDWRAMMVSALKEQIQDTSHKLSRTDRVAFERQAAQEVDAMNVAKAFKGEAEKLLEFCRRAKKDTAWYDLPKSSPERIKRLNALRKDYFQKTH